MKYLYLLGLLGLAIVLQAQPQVFVFKNGSETFEKALASKPKADAPGYALAVVHKDSVIFSAASGLANMTTGEKIDLNTPFYIASIGKTMTAAAVLLLRQAQQIQLQDFIGKYLPDLPAFAQEIRIYHLLTHTSGLPDFYDALGIGLQNFTNKDVFKFVQKCDSLEFPPGVDYAYSNTAYVLLAMIVEKASGASFSNYLHTKFFEPFGMQQTFVKDNPEIPIPNSAIGYSADSTGVFRENDYEGIFTTGSGGIYSTVGDLHKWLIGLRSGKVLSQRSLSLMLDFPTTSAGYMSYIGMGWTNETPGPKTPEWQGLRTFGSIGMLKGFRTKILYYPDLELDFILLCNSGEMAVFSSEFIQHFAKKISCANSVGN